MNDKNESSCPSPVSISTFSLPITQSTSSSSTTTTTTIEDTCTTSTTTTTTEEGISTTSQQDDEPPEINELETLSEDATNLITNKSNGLGLYQVLSFILISLAWSIGNGWYAYISVFTGIIPEHTCIINNLTNQTNNLYSSESCQIRNIETNETYKQCDSYEYKHLQMKSTIISEYNFVCQRDYYFESAYSLEQSGYIFGTLIFSLLADKKGRRYVYLFVLFFMCLFGLVQYFIKNFYLYMFIGFIINLLASGLDSVCVPYVLETFNTQKRTSFGIGIEYIWVIVLTSLSLVAYFINTWRELRLFIFFILILIFIISYYFLNESLTWLISVEKFQEAKLCINSISKFNRLTNSNNQQQYQQEKNELFNRIDKLNDILSEKSKENNHLKSNVFKECYQELINTFNALFKYSKFRLYVLIMSLNWFATALVYDGLTYLSNNIGNNVFISWTLMNIVELPAQFMCFYLVSRFGRRITTCLSLIICGLALMSNYIIYSFVNINDERISLGLYLLAKFSSTQAYSAVILHAPEIFPTNLRSFGYGICLFSGKLTSVLSPFISLYLTKILAWLPGVIYGLISILCGLICLYVPETLNRPLPNTIEDVLRWTKTLTKEEWTQVKQLNKIKLHKTILKSIKKCFCTKRRASIYVYTEKFTNDSSSTKNEIILKSYSDTLT